MSHHFDPLCQEIRQVKSVLICYFWFSIHSIKISLELLILLLLFFLFSLLHIFKRCSTSPVFLLLSALSSRDFCPSSSNKLNPSFSYLGISIYGWTASSAYQCPGRRHVHTGGKVFWLYKACCRTVNTNEEITMPRSHQIDCKLREE